MNCRKCRRNPCCCPGGRNNPYGYQEEADEDQAKAARLREISERAMSGEWAGRKNPRGVAAGRSSFIVGQVRHGREGSVMILRDAGGYDVILVVGDEAQIMSTHEDSCEGLAEAGRAAEQLLRATAK